MGRGGIDEVDVEPTTRSHLQNIMN
jgi:hypothetical protein